MKKTNNLKEVLTWEVHLTICGYPVTVEVKSVSMEGAKEVVRNGFKVKDAHIKIEIDPEKHLEDKFLP